ncbi:MAG: hypothetical protein K2Y39_23170 [Candidatus Obscuribacterales bacterium]|nr:hypothetical protein [Candidatus Obscuribacterales bacterium]
MCAAWNSINNENSQHRQQWARRYAIIARPAIKLVAEIVMSPIELLQKLFYRPNARQDEFVVEDLNAKFKKSLNENYIACFSQKMHNKPVALKLDPRKTYDNLEACQSGTFKTIDSENWQEEKVPELQLIDKIEEQKLAINVVYLPSASLSDSQIMRARKAQSSFTQSGIYQLVEPDINPHGLQQFIEKKEEKTA